MYSLLVQFPAGKSRRGTLVWYRCPARSLAYAGNVEQIKSVGSMRLLTQLFAAGWAGFMRA